MTYTNQVGATPSMLSLSIPLSVFSSNAIALADTGNFAVVVGNGRSFLTLLVTGDLSSERVQSVLDAVNPTLPHYKQVRAFRIIKVPFTIENGLLTANGKLKRDLIAQRFQPQIEEMYTVKQSSTA